MNICYKITAISIGLRFLGSISPICLKFYFIIFCINIISSIKIANFIQYSISAIPAQEKESITGRAFKRNFFTVQSFVRILRITHSATNQVVRNFDFTGTPFGIKNDIFGVSRGQFCHRGSECRIRVPPLKSFPALRGLFQHKCCRIRITINRIPIQHRRISAIIHISDGISLFPLGKKLLISFIRSKYFFYRCCKV